MGPGCQDWAGPVATGDAKGQLWSQQRLFRWAAERGEKPTAPASWAERHLVPGLPWLKGRLPRLPSGRCPGEWALLAPVSARAATAPGLTSWEGNFLSKQTWERRCLRRAFFSVPRTRSQGNGERGEIRKTVRRTALPAAGQGARHTHSHLGTQMRT